MSHIMVETKHDGHAIGPGGLYTQVNKLFFLKIHFIFDLGGFNNPTLFFSTSM